MEHEISLKWLEKMAFEATQPDGYTLRLDAAENPDVPATRPKPLLLSALAGCTGMDVISLLEKMRVPVKDMEIKVSGELTEEHPRTYKSMHITYILTGENIEKEKVIKAIELSQEKYCGVSAILKKGAAITYSLEIRS
jgi:putative redox protein